MTKVWAVVADGRGAHEAEAIVSLWSTPGAAEAECARVNRLHPDPLGRSPDFFVVELPLDPVTPSDEPLT